MGYYGVQGQVAVWGAALGCREIPYRECGNRHWDVVGGLAAAGLALSVSKPHPLIDNLPSCT